DQRVADGLRPGRLLLRISQVVAFEVGGFRDPFSFGLRQPVGRQPGRSRRVRCVDTEYVLREPAAEDRGDRTSPVAAVGYKPAVAQLPHQFHPGGHDLLDSPPGGGRLVAETKTWQRRGYDVECR